jgi:O-antigen/teichoic acid export membrane protein
VAAQAQRSLGSALTWAYAGNWGQRGGSALFTLILAGFLGPKAFGTISLAMVYISFLQMIIDQGFVTAIIQKRDLESEHLTAVFWLQQATAILLIVVSVLLSGWWARRNHLPEIGLVISVLSCCLPLEALASVQCAVLSREMDFRSLAIRANIAVMASGVVGLIVASAGYGVWALVAQQITRDFIALVLVWKLSAWRPQLSFSLTAAKELLGFSATTFVARLGLFLNGQMDSIVMGIFFGPVAVGLYRIAERIMNSVVVLAMAAVQSVALPEFSRFQHDPAKLRTSALSCIRLTSETTIPALAGLAIVSRPLMATVGYGWLPASDVLSILSALAILMVLTYFTSPVLQALSRPHYVVVIEWCRTALNIGVLVVTGLLMRNSTPQLQITGIAFARFLTNGLIVSPVFIYLLARLCKLSVSDLWIAVKPAALAAAGVIAVVAPIGYGGFLAHSTAPLLLGVEILIGGMTGAAIIAGFDSSWRQRIFGAVARRRASIEG